MRKRNSAWTAIGEVLGRSGKRCSERYRKLLDRSSCITSQGDDDVAAVEESANQREVVGILVDTDCEANDNSAMEIDVVARTEELRDP